MVNFSDSVENGKCRRPDRLFRGAGDNNTAGDVTGSVVLLIVSNWRPDCEPPLPPAGQDDDPLWSQSAGDKVTRRKSAAFRCAPPRNGVWPKAPRESTQIGRGAQFLRRLPGVTRRAGMRCGQRQRRRGVRRVMAMKTSWPNRAKSGSLLKISTLTKFQRAFSSLEIFARAVLCTECKPYFDGFSTFFAQDSPHPDRGRNVTGNPMVRRGRSAIRRHIQQCHSPLGGRSRYITSHTGTVIRAPRITCGKAQRMPRRM